MRHSVLALGSFNEELLTWLAVRCEVSHRSTGELEPQREELVNIDTLLIRSPFRLSEATLDLWPALTHVVRAGSGLDNLPVDKLHIRHIRVDRIPSASRSVAELAIGLLLCLLRQVTKLDSDMKHGLWGKNDARGRELSGLKVAVIGLGEIGQCLGGLLLALGAKLVVVDRSPLKPEKQLWLRRYEAKLLSLKAALEECEACILCCSANAENKPLLTRDHLALMRGAYLVNVGRGSLVSELDMLHALDAGYCRAIATDVYGVEPPGASRLVGHPSVIATPHIGAQTIEAKLRISKNIESLLGELWPNEP